MPEQKPLDIHQQELVNLVKAAHRTLAIARKTRTVEQAKRIQEAKVRSHREFERTKQSIIEDIDAEVTVHECNLDDALIAAYNSGVPVRRIALEGFGNRYDGGVQQLIAKLRADGRVGSREGFQRNTTDAGLAVASFPKPIDVSGILQDSTHRIDPTFRRNEVPLVLVEADQNGEGEVTAPSVTLELDARDPWFAQIAANMRPNTPYRYANTVTLYQHPATGELIAAESRETGEVIWDHPVARWVKDHPEQALAGFQAAMELSIAVLSEQGIRAEISE